MPKQRAKSKHKFKRHKKQGSLGIYILAGICATFLLWFLIKEPVPEPDSGSQISQTEKQEEPKKATEKKLKKAARKAVDKSAAKSTNKAAQVVNPTEKAAKQIKPKTAETPAVTELDDVIKSSIDKLGIPNSYFKRRKSGDIITYSVPVDRSTMDLVYANMIFKGELERCGGIFLKGTDSSGKQSLTFGSKDSPKKYIINLYYDNKLYSQKTTPRTIAIVVDDFGAIGGDLLDDFLALEPAVNFAIFPDEANSVVTMQRATAQGRETLIHVPMEPIGYPNVNPGKNAIFVQYDAAQIDKIITRFIQQLPDCEGINNHMGSLATTDEDVMRAVMVTLKKHDKFFLDSRTSNVSVGYPIAQKAHIRSFRNDLFLDSPNISQSTMDARLSQIIEMSAKKSSIIAITHCHNREKLEYLRRFIAKLKAAGFTIVPLSEVGKYNVPGLL